jgi:CspA family cold shock protein
VIVQSSLQRSHPIPIPPGAIDRILEVAMRHRLLVRAIRNFSQCSLMLLVLSGWLAACSSDGPAAAAEIWYSGYHALDSRTIEGLTCNARLSDAQSLFQKNSETVHQFNSYSFDISQVRFRTVDRTGEAAIVEAKGIETVFLNQEPASSEVKKNWQFVRESGVWKWCGDLPYQEEASPFSGVLVGITVVVGLVAGGGFFVWMFGRRMAKYSDYITESEDGTHQIEDFRAGWIRSFSKAKGWGLIYDDRSREYWFDYDSFVNRAYQNLNNGERVLFQVERNGRGPRARNVIRAENNTSTTNPHSRKLVILADRVKKLRQDFRFYKVTLLQKELNTCKSFFELLDLDVKRYHIRLADYEVVLLYEVGKDLHALSNEIDAMADDSRLWVRVLHLALQVLNVVADVIERVSPHTAELLRSLGRSAGHLLDSRQPPLLGPGKE